MSNVEQTMAIYKKKQKKQLSLESLVQFSNRDWPEVTIPNTWLLWICHMLPDVVPQIVKHTHHGYLHSCVVSLRLKLLVPISFCQAAWHDFPENWQGNFDTITKGSGRGGGRGQSHPTVWNPALQDICNWVAWYGTLGWNCTCIICYSLVGIVGGYLYY